MSKNGAPSKRRRDADYALEEAVRKLSDDQLAEILAAMQQVPELDAATALLAQRLLNEQSRRFAA